MQLSTAVNNKRPPETVETKSVNPKKQKTTGSLSTIKGLKKTCISFSQPYDALILPQPDLDHQVLTSQDELIVKQ